MLTPQQLTHALSVLLAEVVIERDQARQQAAELGQGMQNVLAERDRLQARCDEWERHEMQRNVEDRLLTSDQARAIEGDGDDTPIAE